MALSQWFKTMHEKLTYKHYSLSTSASYFLPPGNPASFWFTHLEHSHYHSTPKLTIHDPNKSCLFPRSSNPMWSHFSLATMRQGQVPSTFYRWGNWGLGSWSYLLKATSECWSWDLNPDCLAWGGEWATLSQTAWCLAGPPLTRRRWHRRAGSRAQPSLQAPEGGRDIFAQSHVRKTTRVAGGYFLMGPMTTGLSLLTWRTPFSLSPWAFQGTPPPTLHQGATHDPQ